MTQSHTPGPWRVDEWEIGEQKRKQTVIINRTDAVAYVQDLWRPDHRKQEKMANAHLLAAAPEMFEALKELDASWSKDLPQGPETPEFCGIRLFPEHARLWKGIRSAIAKAEGKP